MTGNWVVKLGGSLHDADCLPLWLDALAGTGAVVVPGGGPFADQVRASQARWGFGDDAAHAMAILGMRQYGLMLAGLCPAFVTAAEPERLAGCLALGRPAIWLPDPDALAQAEELPAAWSVTSDSLAAWLARRIGAARLLLVKSAALPAAATPAAQLVAAGLVDTAFPSCAAGLDAWLCRREDHTRLSEGFQQPSRVFVPIVADA